LSELETVRRQTLAEVRLQLLGSGTVSEMREMLGLGQASGLYLLGQPLGPLIRTTPLF